MGKQWRLPPNATGSVHACPHLQPPFRPPCPQTHPQAGVHRRCSPRPQQAAQVVLRILRRRQRHRCRRRIRVERCQQLLELVPAAEAAAAQAHHLVRGAMQLQHGWGARPLVQAVHVLSDERPRPACVRAGAAAAGSGQPGAAAGCRRPWSSKQQVHVCCRTADAALACALQPSNPLVRRVWADRGELVPAGKAARPVARPVLWRGHELRGTAEGGQSLWKERRGSGERWACGYCTMLGGTARAAEVRRAQRMGAPTGHSRQQPPPAGASWA